MKKPNEFVQSFDLDEMIECLTAIREKHGNLTVLMVDERAHNGMTQVTTMMVGKIIDHSNQDEMNVLLIGDPSFSTKIPASNDLRSVPETKIPASDDIKVIPETKTGIHVPTIEDLMDEDPIPDTKEPNGDNNLLERIEKLEKDLERVNSNNDLLRLLSAYMR